MTCKRCPHHVRHGQYDAANKTIEFKNKCALKLKDGADCAHFPFAKYFDYTACDVYRNTFKGATDRKDVLPTRDLPFNDPVGVGSITDMELL